MDNKCKAIMHLEVQYPASCEKKASPYHIGLSDQKPGTTKHVYSILRFSGLKLYKYFLFLIIHCKRIK